MKIRLKDAAHWYAAKLRLRVLPAQLYPHFQPLIPQWPANATTDATLIEDWWTRRPDAAVCALTGRGNGPFVLDVDEKNGVQGSQSLLNLEAEHGPLPLTWRVRTPSGGTHLWFRAPADVGIKSSVGLAPGLDVRSEGGLVVLPPSIRAGSQYEWLVPPGTIPLADPPRWLVDYVRSTSPCHSDRSALVFRSKQGLGSYLRRAVEGECNAVATAVAGNRNNQLFRSAAALGGFVASGVLPEELIERVLLEAADTAGLDRREAERTIRSGFRAAHSTPRFVEIER